VVSLRVGNFLSFSGELGCLSYPVAYSTRKDGRASAVRARAFRKAGPNLASRINSTHGNPSTFSNIMGPNVAASLQLQQKLLHLFMFAEVLCL